MGINPNLGGGNPTNPTNKDRGYLGWYGLGVLPGIAAHAYNEPENFEWLLGKPGQEKQFPRFAPEQQSAISQTLQQALSRLGGPGESPFAPVANQARQNFQQQTIPSILERFTSLGAGGGRSGVLGQQLGQAGANLESNLASQEIQQLLQLLGIGLTPTFESAYIPRQPGFLEEGLKGLLQYLPMYLAS